MHRALCPLASTYFSAEIPLRKSFQLWHVTQSLRDTREKRFINKVGCAKDYSSVADSNESYSSKKHRNTRVYKNSCMRNKKAFRKWRIGSISKEKSAEVSAWNMECSRMAKTPSSQFALQNLLLSQMFKLFPESSKNRQTYRRFQYLKKSRDWQWNSLKVCFCRPSWSWSLATTTTTKNNLCTCFFLSRNGIFAGRGNKLPDKLIDNFAILL